MSTFPAKYAKEWPYATDYVYDIECYPNFFSLAAKHISSGTRYFFEISEWANDLDNLVSWIYWLHGNKCRQIGFNNLHYDYSLLHHIFTIAPYSRHQSGKSLSWDIYQFSQSRFKGKDETEDQYRRRMYQSAIKPENMIIPQIDLYKIYHFDNKNKATSLKVLQINMRKDNVQELPVPPGTWITPELRAILIPYNHKDVDDTEDFARYSLAEIQLRESLSAKFDINMMNHSEGKIGEDIIKSKLVKAGVDTRKKTFRDKIYLRDVIFPYIRFNRPEFIELHQYLLNQVIDVKELDTEDEESEKVKTKYPCAVVDGFPWQFGKGGMHGSVESSIVRECVDYEIIDVDVVSFYPREGIVNRLAPAHIGSDFTECYESVFNLRLQYPKDKYPMENMAFKYALNVPFGKSNSKFSFLYDPQYTMSITINGQLLLCMLGEALLTVPGLSMIQANTDGITFRSPRRYRKQVEAICKQWEAFTCLELEYAYYQAMYIRDVNNYIAHYTSGKLKYKGAYVFEGIPWNKDHSAVIVARAVSEYFIKGVPVIETISACRDPFDFMIKAKVPRNSELWLTYPDGNRERLQNTTRYYVVTSGGGELKKIMPPTEGQRENWSTGTHYIRPRDGDYKVVKAGGKRPAKTYIEVDPATIPAEPPERSISMEAGWQTADCARAADFDWQKLNIAFYVEQAYKLIDPLVKQC